MTTTLPTESQIAALAEHLRSEDSTAFIYAALMSLCRCYEAYIAELTQPIEPVIDWATPVIVSQGAPRLGGEDERC